MDSTIQPLDGILSGLGKGSDRLRKMIEDLKAGPPIFTPEREAEVKREMDQEIIDHLKKIGINAKRGYTSLSDHDQTITFDKLVRTSENTKVIEKLMKWQPDLHKGILLYGTVGVGKSTLCKAIINAHAGPSCRFLFITMPDALQRLKDAIDDKTKSVGFETEKLCEPKVLILDDLGAEKSSEWAIEKIFTIFEKRAHDRKHTIFTTNLTFERIEKQYGARIADRMLEFCTLLELPGTSFRRRNYRDEF